MIPALSVPSAPNAKPDSTLTPLRKNALIAKVKESDALIASIWTTAKPVIKPETSFPTKTELAVNARPVTI